jgi:MFS family permease
MGLTNVSAFNLAVSTNFRHCILPWNEFSCN